MNVIALVQAPVFPYPESSVIAPVCDRRVEMSIPRSFSEPVTTGSSISRLSMWIRAVVIASFLRNSGTSECIYRNILSGRFGILATASNTEENAVLLQRSHKEPHQRKMDDERAQDIPLGRVAGHESLDRPADHPGQHICGQCVGSERAEQADPHI